MILEIDKVINTTNSTFGCMQEQIRNALQNRSVGSYITPRTPVLVHYPEPKQDEEKGSLMARRRKGPLSISNFQNAFSVHNPLGRDSKVVQEDSAFQFFLDSARSVGIKCSPPQESPKSTSALQTTPTKGNAGTKSQPNSNIEGKDMADESRLVNGTCSNKFRDIMKSPVMEEKVLVAKEKAMSSTMFENVLNNEHEGAVLHPDQTSVNVPIVKYRLNQLLQLRKAACRNPFENNTDHDLKLILPNRLEHRGLPSRFSGRRWGRNVGPTVSNNQVTSLAGEKSNVAEAVFNVEKSGASPLMTFSDQENSPSSTKGKNVKSTNSNVESNVAYVPLADITNSPRKQLGGEPQGNLARNDEAASFLAWMMSREAKKLGGQ
jgi:hypothetical protein